MSQWRILVIIFFMTAVAVLLTIRFFPTTTDFRAGNPFWNGLSDFRDRFRVTSLETLANLPSDAENSVLLVIPSLEFADDDVARLGSYLQVGGTLILADDFGHGNAVLDGLGIPARFNNALLADPAFNTRTPSFPLARNVEQSAFTEGVSSLALNYATTLEGEGLTMVVFSSAFSFLDLNDDGMRNSDEPLGPLPVAGYMPAGSGTLILLSDPSAFINTMLAVEDNFVFLQNIVKSAGGDVRVFLDLAHLPYARMDQAKATLAVVQEVLAHPALLIVLTAVVLTLILRPSLWGLKGALDWTRKS